MTLTIKLGPAAKIALENEAAARNQSNEQTASEVIEAFFNLRGVRKEGYDEWFGAKVEEGLEAAKNGQFVSDDEVERRAMARRRRLLNQVKDRQ